MDTRYVAIALVGLGIVGCGHDVVGPAPAAPANLAATAPPPVTAPPVVLTGNQLPVLDLRFPQGRPRPIAVPVHVSLDTCHSTDSDHEDLIPLFYWGDGSSESGNCRATHVYPVPGKYGLQACVWDRQPGHVVCQLLLVQGL